MASREAISALGDLCLSCSCCRSAFLHFSSVTGSSTSYLTPYLKTLLAFVRVTNSLNLPPRATIVTYNMSYATETMNIPLLTRNSTSIKSPQAQQLSAYLSECHRWRRHPKLDFLGHIIAAVFIRHLTSSLWIK